MYVEIFLIWVTTVSLSNKDGDFFFFFFFFQFLTEFADTRANIICIYPKCLKFQTLYSIFFFGLNFAFYAIVS